MMMMIFGLYFVKIPWLFSTTLLEIGFTRADITLPMKQNPIQSLQLLFFASRFLVNFLPANRQCSCCSSDFILMIRFLVQWCLDCTILSYGGKSGCCLRVQMTVDAVAMAAEQEVSLSHGLSPVTPRYKSVACTCDLLRLLTFACTSPAIGCRDEETKRKQSTYSTVCMNVNDGADKALSCPPVLSKQASPDTILHMGIPV